MDRDAGDIDRRQVRGLGVELPCLRPGNAEFVSAPAGGDLGVSRGINIGIDAERDRGGRAARPGDLVDGLEFGFGFNVDLEYARLEREGDFRRCLADPREDDPLGCDAGRQRPAQLTLRIDIGARPKPAQRMDHGEIGVGLDGVEDRRVERGEGVGERAVVVAERGRRIAVKRRADIGGDDRERNILGRELAILVDKGAHNPSRRDYAASCSAA